MPVAFPTRADRLASESVVELSAPSEITPIRDQRCAGSSRMLSSAVSSAGSRAVMPSWMSTGGGASTGTAARGGGSNSERVPRTGWRFVRHLNRLSALAFLQPVRKVSLGAEFPAPFREPILRPGLPTPLPRAGRAEHTQETERPNDARFVLRAKSEIFGLGSETLPRVRRRDSQRDRVDEAPRAVNAGDARSTFSLMLSSGRREPPTTSPSKS